MIFLDSEGIGIRRIIFFFLRLLPLHLNMKTGGEKLGRFIFVNFFLFFVSFHVIYHLKGSALIFQR